MRVPGADIQLVHNGIELAPAELSRAAWRTRLGLHETALVACMIANLHSYKDHETLIAAWRLVVDRLQQSGRDVHLLLAGESGNRREAIEQQIKESLLTSRVHVLGAVADVTGLLSAIDLCVFSSYNEGLPNAVLEAMSAGLAVVATDYPGIREAVGPAGESLLARPQDPHDMADKIVRALEDPRLRGLAGARGRMRVASDFSVERMTTRMVEMISRELGRVQKTPPARTTQTSKS
jgi:glycosyltransferase involved in cell wall biosynthesis